MLTTLSPGSRLRRIAGLAAVPALLLALAACGDDDGGGGASGDFCDNAKDLDSQFSGDAGDTEDIASALSSIDPPAEIADDWETFVSALEAFNEDPSSVDPEAAGKLEEASANIEKFMEEECGIDASG
ncbi:MAG TPA: hypothetical protein VFI47_25890 [Acidimicrobiales bacterium]|nr:hypothetical protein [Acidimicrobiales bacterium]